MFHINEQICFFILSEFRQQGSQNIMKKEKRSNKNITSVSDKMTIISTASFFFRNFGNLFRFFLKFTWKNIVCFNLITKTSKDWQKFEQILKLNLEETDSKSESDCPLLPKTLLICLSNIFFSNQKQLVIRIKLRIT